MVVDTSAIVAILFGESDASVYADALRQTPTRLISAVTRVELTFVVEGRKREEGRLDLERLLRSGEFEIVSVTPEHAFFAAESFRQFGKGRHPAGLNIGDAFSYALAKAINQPLLFKGTDFSQTDIRSALTPVS